jgi:hypothetical protein
LHKLGIKYVWIDPLCIIQDSEEDWREESSKMADIYSHAHLTIAATRAADGSEALSSPTESAFDFEGTPIVMQGTVNHFNEYYVLDNLDFPLLGRGWVVQETMLSSRVLHFCSGDLVLECS